MELRTVSPSLWLATAAETDFPPLDGDLKVDVAVLGAGITGTTAALLLKEAGRTVALLEMGRIAQGTTGYTTAKLTVGHNLIYADLMESYGEAVTRLYAESNQSAIELIERTVGRLGIDCDWERASNYVYTESPAHVEAIEREVEAAVSVGVDAEFTVETDLPFPVLAAIRVGAQAQFHPCKYVQAVADRIAGGGSYVFEQTRATDVRSGDLCTVETASGRLHARHVVVATHMPFLDRGLFFAKAHAEKSYAVAARVDEERAPRGMYINAELPTRSVRSTPGHEGSRFLIVGGEGHKQVDEAFSERRYEALELFMRERFASEAAEHRWSTHDYSPVDRLPYIGRLRRREERVYVATGFAKWGLTKGTLAAQIITDAILGRASPWSEIYDARRLSPRHSAKGFLRENGRVALRFFGDRARQREGRAALERLKPGDGTIARIGGSQYALYRDEQGRLHALSPRCPHLGCLVSWNRADRAWDCPCHGSRFSADGTLAQGPATRDLRRRPIPGDSEA